MRTKPVKADTERSPGAGRRVLMVAAVLLLIVMSGVAGKVHAELPVVTGEQWMASSDDSKLAFLLGFATMVKVEQNLIGDPPPPGTVSFAPGLARGLDNLTLRDVMTRLDTLYLDHPERMKDAVVTLIWEEIVVPRLEAQKKGGN